MFNGSIPAHPLAWTAGAAVVGVLAAWVMLHLRRKLTQRLVASRARLLAYWKDRFSPLHACVYYNAEDYLAEKYGDRWQHAVAGWALDLGLLRGSPETRLALLDEWARSKTSEGAPDGALDHDSDMHFYFIQRCAVRQWADLLGLAVTGSRSPSFGPSRDPAE